MGVLDKLEQSLVGPLDKKAPVKMPPSARKSLAKALWIIALVFGVLQLWAAWGLWHVGHYVDRAVDYLNSLSSYYGEVIDTTHLGLFYWLAFVVMLVVAVMLLLATPGLKAFKKSGWNLLFYSVVLDVVYGFVRMFSDVGGGFGQFVFTVLISAVGAYFLFQVRDQFTGKAPAEHKAEGSKK